MRTSRTWSRHHENAVGRGVVIMRTSRTWSRHHEDESDVESSS